MALGNNSDNEDSVINTTIVELFALIIFLFIIALSAFAVLYDDLNEQLRVASTTGEEERVVLGDRTDDPNMMPGGSTAGILVQPMFEGMPACLYQIQDVVYRPQANAGGLNFEFRDIQSVYLFKAEFDDLVGKNEPSEWKFTLVKDQGRFSGRVQSWVPLRRAWCAFYQGKAYGAEVMVPLPGGGGEETCQRNATPVSLTETQFDDIKSSFSLASGLFDVYEEGKSGAYNKYKGIDGQTTLKDLLDESFKDGKSCRWQIRIEKSNYCDESRLNASPGELLTILRLNFLNDRLGYNIRVSSGDFDTCREKYGLGSFSDDRMYRTLPAEARKYAERER